MAIQKGLSHCKDILLKERERDKGEVLKLGEAISETRRVDYGRGRDGNAQYCQDLQNKGALKDQAFLKLRKVNIRIEEIDKGIFTGVCPDCGKKRSDKDICEHPLRDLCVRCQCTENNNRR